MTPSLIGQRRLYAQRISHPRFRDAGEAAAWLCAVQGQDYAGTHWAFGLRLPGSTERDIAQAIADGVIVRTWAVRGTLHYLAPADVHWLVGLVAPRLIATNALRYRQLELDEPTLNRGTELIAEALAGGELLSRSVLFDRLEGHGISTDGQRGFYLLQRAGLELRVVQGPMERNVTTFRALPPGKTLARDEALAELARRYFTSRGPATLADFVAWSGLTAGDARAGLESVRSSLARETVEGQEYFTAQEAPQPPERLLYLLPGFDEFVLGYRDRSAVLDAAFADAICPGGNGMFASTIVSEGRIIGTWKRTLKKKAVEIAVTPFRPLSEAEQTLLAEEAARYGAFLGLPVKL